MAEEEKKIDSTCTPEEVKEAVAEETAELPSEACPEEPLPQEDETAAEAPEEISVSETDEPPREEANLQLTELLQKVEAIGEAVETNRRALDCLLEKLLCSPGEEKSMDSAPELISKLAFIESSAREQSQIANEIKAEALALHRLYQNDFAGRIRNMETELERYRKRDAGLAFDGIYKEIAQVYVDFEDLGDGVEDEKLARNIRYLLEEIEELLLSHGVEKMKSEEGEKRNLSFTQVVDRIMTNDPALEGIVAKSLSSGFYIEKRCLIKERVNVYRYEAPAPVVEEIEEATEETATAREPEPIEKATDNE